MTDSKDRLAALRQEIADFDGRVERERARASVKVEAAKAQGAPTGNQNAAKGEENKGNNVTFESTGKAKRGNRAEYIIARLKRDAATDTRAAALLGSIEAGDLKPYRAASLAIASRILTALRAKSCSYLTKSGLRLAIS